jgi:hypothetical protein
MDTPLHRERDCYDGRNSERLLVCCQRIWLGVALRELPVVVPQPDIVPVIMKRVNDESLLVVSNDNGAIAVTLSSQVMNAAAEATGIAYAR